MLAGTRLRNPLRDSPGESSRFKNHCGSACESPGGSCPTRPVWVFEFQNPQGQRYVPHRPWSREELSSSCWTHCFVWLNLLAAGFLEDGGGPRCD